jgi:hypothetical protein
MLNKITVGIKSNKANMTNPMDTDEANIKIMEKGRRIIIIQRKSNM